MSDCEKKNTDSVDTERADTEHSTTELSDNYTLDFGEDLTYHQHGDHESYFTYRDAEGTEYWVPAPDDTNTPVLEIALRRVMAEVRELRAQVKDLQPPF